MFAPRVICGPPLHVRQVAIEQSSLEWTAAADYETVVESEWQRMRARDALWDGTFYRVLDPGSFQRGAVRLGVVRYRYIATFPALHRHHARCGLDPLNHLSTAALLRTRDGHYMFGIRSRNGAVELIGGGVQPDELPVATGADIERNLYKEISEEVGIPPTDVTELTGLGVLFSSTSNVIILAHAQLAIGREEAKAMFAQRSDPEMAEAIFVRSSDLRKFLTALPDYRALVADLLASRSVG